MPRLRNLGITLGHFPSGPLNAITDVPGVQVGHATLIEDAPRVVRTGITVILPRGADSWKENVFAAFHSLNGNGEMTGAHFLVETGLLAGPIGLTNTYQVGLVRDAFIEYARANGLPETPSSDLPVVAETWDGWLSDISAFPLTKEHVFAALESAASGPIAEGNVGGGTGMICHEFKGGIGTSSRRMQIAGKEFTLGALVQANHGSRRLLRVDGIPVGRLIGDDNPPSPWAAEVQKSSLIVSLAMDAPLLPDQCRRLAQRAGLGMARVGGIGHNLSGDIFLAFSTANAHPQDAEGILSLQSLVSQDMNPLFETAIEATEEAILNALCAAETLTGFEGHTAHALPLDRLQEIMSRARNAGVL